MVVTIPLFFKSMPLAPSGHGLLRNFRLSRFTKMAHFFQELRPFHDFLTKNFTSVKDTFTGGALWKVPKRAEISLRSTKSAWCLHNDSTPRDLSGVGGAQGIFPSTPVSKHAGAFPYPPYFCFLKLAFIFLINIGDTWITAFVPEPAGLYV